MKNYKAKVKCDITGSMFFNTLSFGSLALAMAVVTAIDDDIKIKNLSNAGKYLDSKCSVAV